MTAVRNAIVIAITVALGLGSPVLAADAYARSHTVTKGETLGGIAQRFGCTTDAIRRANKLSGDMIKIGQQLDIPERCDSGAAATGAAVVHTVLPGDTLAGIAARYGDTVDGLKSRNRRVIGKKNMLRVGQKLRVMPTKAVLPPRKVRYKIEAGDTLGAIAVRYDLTVSDIKRMNPKKDPRRLRVGDTIDLWIEGPVIRSAAVGRPQHGELVNGQQLPTGRSWYRRRPERSWGTNETIALLSDAFDAVQKKHPRAHDIAVGDISAKTGGRLAGHKSHQSGRDVDLGFYFTGQPKTGPKAFLDASRRPLDYEATWELLTVLAGPAPDKSRVEYMFIGYAVQKKLYDWAKKQGVSQRKLDWMFQYPRGSRAMRGVIRHEPGHNNHIHVRFKCPKGDNKCL